VAERLKFIVWRGKWLRGTKYEGCLLDSDGRRCCLGHLGRDVGIADGQIFGEALPANVTSPLWPSQLSKGPGSLEWDAANINDDTEISDERREYLLTERFAREGIDVEFRDGDGS
jgi:hypothetical protein